MLKNLGTSYVGKKGSNPSSSKSKQDEDTSQSKQKDKHEGEFASFHYDNTPMQYRMIYMYCDFYGCKIDNFQMKKLIFFLFLLKTEVVGTH